MKTTPALGQLSGVYFNQGWAVDYRSWEEAVDAFIAESSEDVPSLPDEIARVLDAYDSDEHLRGFMLAQGWAYRPRPEDGGYLGLLTGIARRVEAAG